MGMQRILKTMGLTFALGFFVLSTASGLQAAEYKNPAVPGEESAAYWLDLGGLYATYGNFEAAIRAYLKSLDIEANSAEAYFGLAVAYTEKGDLDQAITSVDRAISLAPDNGRYHYGRAWILLKSGRQDESRAAFEKAADLGDLDAQDYLKENAAGQ